MKDVAVGLVQTGQVAVNGHGRQQDKFFVTWQKFPPETRVFKMLFGSPGQNLHHMFELVVLGSGAANDTFGGDLMSWQEVSRQYYLPLLGVVWNCKAIICIL
jgi:hypothetical protein